MSHVDFALDVTCGETLAGNICSRFLLQMKFQHNRKSRQETLKFWILRESDDIAGGLAATYTGDRIINSDQVVIIDGATGKPGPEEEEIVCFGIRETLSQSLKGNNVTILDVVCTSFIFVAGPSRGLRRWLQNVGTLNVKFEVSGEYRPLPGKVDTMKDEFGGLVEVSFRCWV